MSDEGRDSYFVDVRILKDKSTKHDSATNSYLDLDWAFAGRSITRPISPSGPETGVRFHSTWEHWIGSKSNEPEADEGDMTVLEDGTVLEEGSNTDRETGSRSKYEELWKDLPIEPVEQSNTRDCLVLRAVGEKEVILGMIIKIGRWCQGIIKIDGCLTVERWQFTPAAEYTPTDEGEHVTKSSVSEEAWIRTYKMGEYDIPCGQICNGNDTKFVDTGAGCAKVKWEIIEDFHW